VCLTPLLVVIFAYKKAPEPNKSRNGKKPLCMSGSQARRALESRLVKAIAREGFISVTGDQNMAVEFECKYSAFIMWRSLSPAFVLL
jgi:hypothetical protein